MSATPIFLATHPRSCSTAFERVFMTRSDLSCIHEPFGDAFYYGPERLSSRFANDEQARIDSGLSKSTYHTVLDGIEKKFAEGKRLFIKDMMYYLVAPEGSQTYIAPSLARKERGVGTAGSSTNGDAEETSRIPDDEVCRKPGNPTVVPEEILERFHFTFLIRHPKSSIPSFFRCTVPPLDKMTGFHSFMPSEAGYSELRQFFDYLQATGRIGPGFATMKDLPVEESGTDLRQPSAVEICVIDADDLLDHPADIVEAYCGSVGLEFDPSMLIWDTKADHKQATTAFEKWKGFHEDAISSNDLTPRVHGKKMKSKEVEDAEWAEKFGHEQAKMIRETVDANVEDYEYLKQFALKPLRN